MKKNKKMFVNFTQRILFMFYSNFFFSKILIIILLHVNYAFVMNFQTALCDRYNGLHKPMNLRKQKLFDSLQVQQLFRDVEDEEAWIREKEPVAGSTNRG